MIVVLLVYIDHLGDELIVKYFCLAAALSIILSQAESAKILAVFSFPGKSHLMMTKAVIKELTIRGHQVTCITSFPIGEKLDNYTEIVIDPVYDFWKEIRVHFKTNNLFDLTEMTMLQFMEMLDILGIATTEHALKLPAVQHLINDTKNDFDLFLAEQFYQEAFLALAYKYNIPVITMSTLGFENYMSQMMGLITPWSFVPHGFLPFDDKMTFYERLLNTVFSLYEDFYREYWYFPKQDKLVQKYFSHLPVELPSVSQMEKNISAILLNSYIPLTTPRPSVMGLISVGGVHIKPPKPLPNDIKKFLDEAEHGAIYFSLGTNLKSSDMPSDKLQIFLKIFRNIKQRILWKWEDENIPELPNNVMVKKWMPQSDILAHPNVKVFITHGGLFGTQEGVYYGIPMLGLPVYCDQHLNMNKAAIAGYAISLNFLTITEESLKNALHELLYNACYKNSVKRVSEIFRDRPMNAMDTAMYWIDYVIRHKGAPQIRSAGLDMPWYSFYLLDIISLITGVILVTILSFYIILKALFKSKRSKQKLN